MTSNGLPAIHDLEAALAALDDGLGTATRVHLAPAAGVAVGRWRHAGASMALGSVKPVRLVFSLIGGQQLRWCRDRGVMTSVARCGSIAIVRPDPAAHIDILGRGDTLQILIADAGGTSGRPNTMTPSGTRQSIRLRALAAQALVAMRMGQAQRLDPLLVAIARLVTTPAPRPPRIVGGLAPATLARIKADVRAQLRVDPERLPSVAALADQAGLSLWHFIRAFTASAGNTPHAWMADQRRDLALVHLLERGSSITDAAIASGHGSAAHFVATFRRVIGVTPGKLQEAVLEG